MLSTVIVFAVYLFIFFGVFVGLIIWRKRSRKDRKPFPDQLKLQRGPGETVRKRMNELDEKSVDKFLVAFITPLVIAGALLWITTRLAPSWQPVSLIVTLIFTLATLAWVANRLIAHLQEWQNCYLGYFGERIVGEALDPLKTDGFRIFHDVPAGDAKNPFNIDHVIVGPSGVFAVETKTRRKGRARAGFAEHQIIYDGQVLAYPWGEDRHGLDQAARQAVWLQAWLEQLIGQPVRVQPILTFPGWMVITRARGAVTVLNPKQIPAAVALRGAPALDDRQLDLIARQLDSRCRDVEF
ncbi:MAG: nuclease-related domain-containing protein [Rariglobus sp.]|nr:nuclease-related domain-containing protein [Rariglobus sp.]